MDAVSQAVNEACGALSNINQTLWIAYSGGMDSHVLLHAFCKVSKQFPELSLKAVHVNHQLQDEAERWEKHCHSVCEALNVPYTSLSVDAKPQSGDSPEDAARKARYQAIEQCLEPGDILLTAHHQTDQAETLLLQLMRGSGLAGLAAMPEQRDKQSYQHGRPLLNLSRVSLLSYAKENQLQWVEDPTNDDRAIRRNYIRHEVVPVLEQQWPNASHLIASSAAYLADSFELLTECLDDYLELVLIGPDVLALEPLLEFSRNKQFHIIRHWYRSLGLAQPGADKLSVILDEIILAREDATPKLQWQGSQLIRHRNRLILLPNWAEPDSDKCIVLSEQGISTDYWSFSMNAPTEDRELTIRYGDYGEIVRLNGQTKKLKQLYKDKGLPVALRAVIPKIYADEELILVPGIWQSGTTPELDYQFDFNRLGLKSKHRYSLLTILIAS